MPALRSAGATPPLLLPFCLALGFAARAQSTPAPLIADATPAKTITLGQSIVALNGPWKFHIGDNPKWANPNFDDSQWQDYVIDPSHPHLSAVQAIETPELPGWQSHGHPRYTGYAWYRIRLQVVPGTHSLALLMPTYLDDAYQVFADGRQIGSFGEVDGRHFVYANEPQLLKLPAGAGTDDRPLLLAIRMWNTSYEVAPRFDGLFGGLRGVPLLGPPNLLHVFLQSAQQQIVKTPLSLWLDVASFGAVGVLSLLLFFFSRSQREYLWAGVAFSLLSLSLVAMAMVSAQQTVIPFQIGEPINLLTGGAGLTALPLAAMYVLGVPRRLWRRLNYVAAAILMLDLGIICGLTAGLLPSKRRWVK